MGQAISTIWSNATDTGQRRVVLAGLDGCGQSTLFARFPDTTRSGCPDPRVRYVLESKAVSLNSLTIGGNDRMDVFVRLFVRDASAIVWFVDGVDRERCVDTPTCGNQSSRTELKLLANEEIKGIPLLVLVNKSDLKNALTPSEVVDTFNLDAKSQPHTAAASSASAAASTSTATAAATATAQPIASSANSTATATATATAPVSTAIRWDAIHGTWSDGRVWCVQPISCRTGDGIASGFDWLTRTLHAYELKRTGYPPLICDSKWPFAMTGGVFTIDARGKPVPETVTATAAAPPTAASGTTATSNAPSKSPPKQK